MGVSEEYILNVAKANPSRHQFFMVRKVDCGLAHGPKDGQSLQVGDIILTLHNQLITQVSHLNIMDGKDQLEALVVRMEKRYVCEFYQCLPKILRQVGLSSSAEPPYRSLITR